MRKILIAAAALLLCAAPAVAADDVMAGFYGNTTISTGGMAEIHTQYKADHTFAFTASAMLIHLSGKGTWKIDSNGQLCRDIENPPAGVPNPSCGPIAAHRVGDTWTVTGKDGSVRTVTLKAGIQ